MKTSDALRLADELGSYRIIGDFVETSESMWATARRAARTSKRRYINPEIPPTCAIGGAALASRAFSIYQEPPLGSWDSGWRIDGNPEVPDTDDWELINRDRGYNVICPKRCVSQGDKHIHRMFSSYRDAIIHLNDTHNWTRSRIADWLDTQDLSCGTTE